MTNCIEIKGLCKSYGDFALKNINLTLPGGSILGLIGENGAGKTTTIKCILNLIRRDAGEITLLGYDNAELQFFMDDLEVITNLDNYADHIHVAGRVTYQMSKAMNTGEYRLTAENRRERLDALREFVVNYDYAGIFAPGEGE